MATTEKKMNEKAKKVYEFLKADGNVGKAFTLAEINEALGLKEDDAIKTGSLNAFVGDGKPITHGEKVSVKVWATRQVATYGVPTESGDLIRESRDTDN